MKKLSINGTKIFCQLLGKLGCQEHVKIQVAHFMPLTMELIGSDIGTPHGKAKWYCVSHHYEQNGDLMRDPEMCFLVIDLRLEAHDWPLIGIYPQRYQQDNLGLYEESVRLGTSGVQNVIPKWQPPIASLPMAG